MKRIIANKKITTVPISEIKKCGRFDAKHYISKEHERLCQVKKSKIN